MAIVPENRRLFAPMTVFENLKMGAYLRGGGEPEDFERIYELFPRVYERREQLAGTLSGGEQQMVAMGRALMSRPKLLLMDEPSMGLAPILVEKSFEIIKQVNDAGVAVLVVEQNANVSLSIADRGYVLSTGRVVLEGKAAELLVHDDLRKAYLGVSVASASAAATSAASAPRPPSSARGPTRRRRGRSWTRPGRRASAGSTPPMPTAAARASRSSAAGAPTARRSGWSVTTKVFNPLYEGDDARALARPDPPQRRGQPRAARRRPDRPTTWPTTATSRRRSPRRSPPSRSWSPRGRSAPGACRTTTPRPIARGARARPAGARPERLLAAQPRRRGGRAAALRRARDRLRPVRPARGRLAGRASTGGAPPIRRARG